jgi:formylglycine-generating enzyme required for sulfatase activity
MGSSNLEIGHQDNEKQHEVCVKKFDLGKFEVTQEQWEKVMLGNLLQPVNLSTWKDEENLPVQMVNWFEAQEFVRNMNWFGHWQYRLPTEAEWEYAARAGEKASWHWGNNEKEACDYANVMDWRTKSWLGPNAPCRGFECSDRHPNLARVGSYKANAFGLYDIIGNVSEWTCSAYGTYDEDLHKNCSDSSVDGSRVLRGGNWYDSVVFVRSAYRWVQDPNVRGNAQGLRLARTNR